MIDGFTDMPARFSPAVRGRFGFIAAAGLALLCATAPGATPGSGPDANTNRVVGFPDIPPAALKSVPQSIADLRAIEKRVQALLPLVQPAVVALDFGGSSGSGVVVSRDGYVLTAAHVSQSPNRDVRIIFPDGRRVRGRTLGANHEIDAGLVKISEEGPWPYAEMSRAHDLRLGDWTLTMGHPGGFDRDRPPVVRLGRVVRLASPMLQTECTITAGDSGGPLFDLRGDVVGIHSRINDAANENYHAPITAFLESWERLKKGEKWGEDAPPERPSIGARGKDHADGCELEFVEEDGPAAKAGIKVGDVLHSIDGAKVEGSDWFRTRLRESKPGDVLDVVVYRDSKPISAKVKVGVRMPRR